MKMYRVLAPAAAPLRLTDLLRGLAGIVSAKRRLACLERELRGHFDAKHVFLLTSGKAALALTVSGLRTLSARRHVVLPAYTCFSVPSALVRAGACLSVCDMDPHTLDFDYGCLENLVDKSTLCVVAVHLLGLQCDVARVRRICERKGVFIIEDAAQAMSLESRESRIGRLGDVSVLSLGRGKNVTAGSGGVILTNSDAIADAIRVEYTKLEKQSLSGVISNFVQVAAMYLLLNPRVYWLPAQLPFLKLGETKFCADFPMHRMDGVRAALCSKWKARLAESNMAREVVAKDYIDHLAPHVDVVRSGHGAPTTYLRLPILTDSRAAKDRLCALAKERGLGISPLYPGPIQSIPELEGRVSPDALPGAVSIAERLVTLPVHHLVGAEDRRRICALLQEENQMKIQQGQPSSAHPAGRVTAPARS